MVQRNIFIVNVVVICLVLNQSKQFYSKEYINNLEMNGWCRLTEAAMRKEWEWMLEVRYNAMQKKDAENQ